jgi:hypothetical protein
MMHLKPLRHETLVRRLSLGCHRLFLLLLLLQRQSLRLLLLPKLLNLSHLL